MGGASGAISACMGMYLLLRANADIEFKYFYFFLFFGADSGNFSLPAWMAISFWFLKDLFWAVLGFFYEHVGGSVAFGAHVGGFLAGLGLIGIGKLFERKQDADTTAKPIRAGPIRVFVPAHRETAPAETPTIYLHDDGVQSGPFTLFQIEQMLACGSLSQDALYWSEGMADWGNVLGTVRPAFRDNPRSQPRNLNGRELEWAGIFGVMTFNFESSKLLRE